MAGQPDPLRLFDLDDEALATSQSETSASVSHGETARPPSQIETSRGASQAGTRALARDNWSPKGQDADALKRAGAAAVGAEAAQWALDKAIAAARSAGASWRRIGAATGLPYQTVHRRRSSRTVTGAGDAPTARTRSDDQPPEAG
jgi:hypothetical protein